MARAKSLPEAAKLQAEFFQTAFVKAGEQTRELMELSAKAASQTFGMANATAAKSAETVKRSAKR
jgi:phasin family protein